MLISEILGYRVECKKKNVQPFSIPKNAEEKDKGINDKEEKKEAKNA